MGFRRSPETTTRQGRTSRAVREYAPFHAGTLALGHAGPGAWAQGRGRRHATVRHIGEHNLEIHGPHDDSLDEAHRKRRDALEPGPQHGTQKTNEKRSSPTRPFTRVTISGYSWTSSTKMSVQPSTKVRSENMVTRKMKSPAFRAPVRVSCASTSSNRLSHDRRYSSFYQTHGWHSSCQPGGHLSQEGPSLRSASNAATAQ